jgi:hypothetical protein
VAAIASKFQQESKHCGLVPAGTQAVALAADISFLSTQQSVETRHTERTKKANCLYCVANSIVPIPAKLVSCIQALEYVDMRKLLPDNLALVERLAALPQSLAPPNPTGEREISGDKALMTWVSSSCTYVAEAHPGRVGDMLAYIVCEASKFGWLTYDAVFRRNHEDTLPPGTTSMPLFIRCIK